MRHGVVAQKTKTQNKEDLLRHKKLVSYLVIGQKMECVSLTCHKAAHLISFLYRV